MRYMERFSYSLMDDDEDDFYPKCSPSMMPMPEIRVEQLQSASSKGNAASRAKHAIKGLLRRSNSKESSFSYPLNWIHTSASDETPRATPRSSAFFSDENATSPACSEAGPAYNDHHAYNAKHAFKAAFERPAGVQASTTPRGALGRPLSNITNRGSKRALKTMAVVPEHSDDKDVTFDGLYFSDGRFLSYTIEDAPELCNSDCTVLPFSVRHQGAIFSPHDIILCLDTGYLPDEHQLLRGPVTAGKIAAAMRAFYATRISPPQYDLMIQAGRARSRESRADFEARLQTYGDLKRDKIFFEGLSIVSVEPLMYRINWASWLG